MRIFTHPSTTSLDLRKQEYFPNCWNGSLLNSSVGSLEMDCTGETIIREMYGANGKCSFGIEVFTMHAHKSFPLCANAAACRRSMHRNSQFLVGLSITVLNYTASWGHFVPGNSKRSTSNISHLSHFSYIAYENSHDVLTGCEYHVTSHPRQLDPTPFIALGHF